MQKNKVIGLSLIALGALLIVIIGGLVLSRSGRMGGYGSLSDGRNAMMETGLPSSDLPFIGSGGSDEAGVIVPETATSPKMMIADEGAAPASPLAEKKVVKNGNLELRVSRVDDANREIGRIAAANGGEVSASSVYVDPISKIKSGSVTVRVPVANFQKTFDELKKVATLVLGENTSGQDVTEQYTDLQSRLRNKQAEEASIAKILERAGDIEDVLKVTRELNRVRGEVEILQGQIKLMDSQTDRATIYVSMTEDQDVTIVDSWRPWQLVKDSVNDLIKGIQRFIDFAIVLVISILPVLILYFILVYVLYRIGKKLYLRWKAKKEQSQV